MYVVMVLLNTRFIDTGRDSETIVPEQTPAGTSHSTEEVRI